ncbi:MAG: histidinol dehydrogenase, partial [Oscillospiraceae bacterium]|nr:histidinol dehydrogenase [Oscillospiraceae bacterium]
MLPITVCNGKRERAVFDHLKARGGEADARVAASVREIIAEVKARGDEALREYTLRFDKADLARIEVSPAEMEAAAAKCDPAFIAALERVSENIRDFHARQLRQSWFTTGEHGVMLGQRVRGLRRVGVYVPGGTAPLPSSVLMNAIPAKIAGVGEIIMATPPWKGSASPEILAAARIAGVDRVFLVGGAQAVAAMAYGTGTIPGVDKIVGPGNIYVATAKKLLYGVVDIDMIAGPSEILVIADETARPAWLAADLLSQAEHDALASAILLTSSQAVAEATVRELELQWSRLPRKEIAEQALKSFGAVFVCESVEQAIQYANDFAPEHLELCVANPMDWLGAIDNAGSVFLGHYTPESVGDYFAGPNHVLPTGGTPRFFSPLSVDDFIKKTQFISYTRPALEEARETILALAGREG